MRKTGSRLTLPIPDRFNLKAAVCHYGFYALAPNQWDESTQSLARPLTFDDGVASVRISMPRHDRLVVKCDCTLDRAAQRQAKRQVSRMLRLEEDFASWRAMHRAAARARFDRLFRSPTLFEDIVKTITCCNVAWANTVNMNRLLCEHFGDGAFPTPRQLAQATPDRIKRLARVGYRAESIHQLAVDVASGTVDLEVFESAGWDTEMLTRHLRELRGVGPYAARNLAMLLGRYDHIAFDTEVYRHFREAHGIATPKDAAALKRLESRIERHYARYHPYQFLAYWFELWNGYGDRFEL